MVEPGIVGRSASFQCTIEFCVCHGDGPGGLPPPPGPQVLLHAPGRSGGNVTVDTSPYATMAVMWWDGSLLYDTRAEAAAASYLSAMEHQRIWLTIGEGEDSEFVRKVVRYGD